MENKTSIIVSSIVMLIGAGVLLIVLLFKFDLFLLILGGLLFFIPIIFIKNQFNKSETIEDKTYEWYKEKYPDNVQGDFVTCFTCENNSIDVRPLIHETFQHEIFCTQCAKTLYYSSESSS